MLHAKPCAKRKKRQRKKEETLKVLSSAFRDADGRPPRQGCGAGCPPSLAFPEAHRQPWSLFSRVGSHSPSFLPGRIEFTEAGSLLVTTTGSGAGLLRLHPKLCHFGLRDLGTVP